MVPASHARPRFLHRLSAWLGVALVLALNVLAVRPDLHAALHEEHGPKHSSACKHHHAPVESAEHDCVVNAFAHGHAETGVAPVGIPFLALDRIGTLLPEHAVAAVAPDFRLPPGCGPPRV
jgi:hypothetical protein